MVKLLGLDGKVKEESKKQYNHPKLPLYPADKVNKKTNFGE